MDSPSFQSTSFDPSRPRTDSIFATTPQSSAVDNRGAVHKRSYNDRSRSSSTLQPERLYQLALDQVNNLVDDLSDSGLNASDAAVRWITPQHSPSLTGYTSAPPIDPYPQWTAPTPPQSDSGTLPAVSIDVNDEPVTCAAPQDFSNFEQPTVPAEMSSLGYLLPSQYGGNSPYESDASNYAMDQNYIPPMRASQAPTSTSTSAYAQQTTSSNPSLYQSRGPESSSQRRHSDMPGSSNIPSYDQTYRRVSGPYDAPVGSNYSMPPTQTIPSISGLTHSPVPSPHLGSTAGSHSSQYAASSIPRSPSLYDTYSQQSAYTTTAPSATQLYSTAQRYPPPAFIGSNANESPNPQQIPSSKPGSSSSNGSPADPSIRVLNQRPKPQCWDHGCNGRQFSTFSNLLRHQREKSGTANKSYCPRCGAEFTRTTARNGHLAHDKCTKQRRESDAK